MSIGINVLNGIISGVSVSIPVLRVVWIWNNFVSMTPSNAGGRSGVATGCVLGYA